MEYIDRWEGAHSKGAIIPWNKGRLVGPKPPLKLKEIWGIRVRLQLATQTRDLALFNLAIDSKLRGCDLVRLKVQDVAHGGRVLSRTAIVQQKTGRPVQFELTEQTRTSIEAWISAVALRPNDYLFPSRASGSPHLSTRQYARVVKSWVESIGLDPLEYGTHSMRRKQARGQALHHTFATAPSCPPIPTASTRGSRVEARGSGLTSHI